MEEGWQSAIRTGEDTVIEPQRIDTLMQALGRTVKAIRAQGKKVILVAPPPSAGFDMARCQSREQEGKPLVAPNGHCDFSRAAFTTFRRPINDFLAQVMQTNTVPVFSFDQELCGSGRCRITVSGKPVYRDLAHFSIPGSRELGRTMKLGEKVRAAAR
jgi:hypothetical protein